MTQQSPTARVLLVEDEPGLQVTITDGLGSEGYDIAIAGDGPTGLHRATHEAWDVILLDVMLPGASGFDVCRDIRTRGIATPIIMLTARGQLVDKVVGLKLGADDYLTKPFEMLELSARIDVQLRRRHAPGNGTSFAPTEYRFGDIAVDLRKAEISRAGRPLDLSAREFTLLKYLLAHRGATITRDELLNQVWGYQAGVDAHGGRPCRVAQTEDRAESETAAVPADGARTRVQIRWIEARLDPGRTILPGNPGSAYPSRRVRRRRS